MTAGERVDVDTRDKGKAYAQRESLLETLVAGGCQLGTPGILAF